MSGFSKRFTRANRPLAGRSGVPGWDLSIAREYARAHGGDVSVVKSEHMGASLRVVLPTEIE